MSITAILLAAGRAERFGSAKLLAPLAAGPHAGLPVGIVAYRNLLTAIDEVIVVLRPNDPALAARFASEHARAVVAHRAGEGMGASLAAGVAAVPGAGGYVIALADMPWIASPTIALVTQTLATGASVVAPRYRGERGHPVGFASAHREALLALRGDEGARPILEAHRDALTLIDVDDPGVLRDVDLPDDLRA